MRPLGMRIVKTSISISICLFLYFAIKCLEFIPGCPENLAYVIYSPFFAGIATAYSIYPDKKSSFTQAKNRCVASVIGGVVAILVVLLYEFVFQKDWPILPNASLTDLIIPYLLISVFPILVISIGVALEQRGAIFVAILTFLSITVNPNSFTGSLGLGTYLGVCIFGLKRILSTVIGVLIALAVNIFQLPHKTKNKDLLFVIGLDGILKNDDEVFKGYSQYKLKSLLYNNINCSMFTTRIPTTFMHLFTDAKLNNPIICCSGAALYDTNKLSYVKTVPIPYDITLEVDKILSPFGVTPFKNYIINDVLNIYCEEINNIGEKLYADKQKNAPYNNVIMGVNENKSDVLYYLLVEEKEVVDRIVDKLKNSKIKDFLTIQIVDYINEDSTITNLKYIKIYNSKINNLGILKEYCTDNNFRLVGLTLDPLANNLLENSDIAVTISDDSLAIERADIVLKKNSYEELFRQISKMYYSKKFQR